MGGLKFLEVIIALKNYLYNWETQAYFCSKIILTIMFLHTLEQGFPTRGNESLSGPQDALWSMAGGPQKIDKGSTT